MNLLDEALTEILKEARTNACDKRYGYTIPNAIAKIRAVFEPILSGNESFIAGLESKITGMETVIRRMRE